MPDMQSELAKVINQWETPVPVHNFKPTNNASRATFNYVRDNPGIARIAAIDNLRKQGYKDTSTSSLLSQMVRQGMIKDSNGGLYTVQPEYTPIKPRLLRAAKKRAYTKSKPVKMSKPEAPTFAKAAPPAADGFNAEQFVGQLSVKQAKDIYDYLKTIFG